MAFDVTQFTSTVHDAIAHLPDCPYANLPPFDITEKECAACSCRDEGDTPT